AKSPRRRVRGLLVGDIDGMGEALHCTRSIAYGCTFRPDQIHNFPLRGTPPTSPMRHPCSLPWGTLPACPTTRARWKRAPRTRYFAVSWTTAFWMVTESRGRSLAPTATAPIALTV